MRFHRFHCVILAGSLAMAVCTSGFGQSEKITVRLAPTPNQTVKMRMIQDMQMELSMPGAPAIPGMQGMKLGTKSVSAITQKVGPANAAGITETEVTFDESSIETTVNGQPMPMAGATSDLAGKKIVIVTDKDGKAIDVKGMDGISAVADSMTQLVKAAGGNLPTTPIAVGETVTAPLDMALPVPVGAGGAVKMTGEVRYKLVSIDKDPDGSRIARFDITTQGAMAPDSAAPSPIPGMQMKMKVTISGSGTTSYNLDKGVIKSSESRNTMSGTVESEGAGLQLPPMAIQGEIKQTINRVN